MIPIWPLSVLFRKHWTDCEVHMADPNFSAVFDVRITKSIQKCSSVEGQPPACFDLVDCCDLDPLTFISEADLEMIVTYLHGKR